MLLGKAGPVVLHHTCTRKSTVNGERMSHYSFELTVVINGLSRYLWGASTTELPVRCHSPSEGEKKHHSLGPRSESQQETFLLSQAKP